MTTSPTRTCSLSLPKIEIELVHRVIDFGSEPRPNLICRMKQMSQFAIGGFVSLHQQQSNERFLEPTE